MGEITTGCPPLRGPRDQLCTLTRPVFVSAGNVDHLTFSSCNTSVGTEVTVGCLGPERKPSFSPHLLCRPDGSWNTSLPLCLAPTAQSTRAPVTTDQLTLETRIIIGVVCGFAALVLLIILTLSLVYYKKVKQVNKRNRSIDLPETEFYWTNPISKRADSPHSNYYQTEINPMYSTRLWRPSYMEHHTAGFYSTPHRTGPPHPPPPPYPDRRGSLTRSISSNSADPWYNRQRHSGDLYTTIRWNPDNMKWHENFDYNRDGRLPRYHMDERGLYRGIWGIF